ncbi:MAG: dephospho-CoA kinase [Betaproteobacteria bacterium]
MLVVGLTGGIGSGKSAVAAAFAARGVEVTDTDLIAHAVTATGAPGFAAVVAAFGPGVLDRAGALDRAALRRIVFADTDARARLESLLHPLISAAARRECAGWHGPYGLLVVPLLFERGGLTRFVERTVVVDCPEDEQIARVTRRSGLPAADVRAIMAAQLPRAERIARADDVIDNGGSPEAIGPQVEALDRVYRELAESRAADPGTGA